MAPYSVAIARRMIGAGRNEEALQWVDAADERDIDGGLEVLEVKTSALEALGRIDEAQQVRWRRVEACLDSDALGPYLERLPSDAAREKASSEIQRVAATHEDPHLGLWFLIECGDRELLGRFVLDRFDELDGAFYEALRPAAEALAGDRPLPATLLHRHMVESVLDRARSTAYDYAARDVRCAAACARRVKRGVVFEGHEAWLERLRALHGRKRAFWRRVDGGDRG